MSRHTSLMLSLTSTPRSQRTFVSLAIGCVAISFCLSSAQGQGLSVDADGHAALNGKPVFACWNFSASTGAAEDYTRYSEFLPFLHGWDFRVNLPHIQFQLARASTATTEATMVGVEEGGTIDTYGHVNNSIWLMQTNTDGKIYAKILPSRRDLNGRETQNITSLTGQWFALAPASSASFAPDKPAAVVLGKGLNAAKIYVVARDAAVALYMTGHTVNGAETVGLDLSVAAKAVTTPPIVGKPWNDPWIPLGITSLVRPSLSEAFDGKLALAWIDAESTELMVQIYTPATSTWGPATAIPGAAVQSPQLVWDGTALNALFVGSGSPVLQHTYALTDDPLAFSASAPVSSLVAVFGDQFHAIAFNNRLQIVIRQDNGGSEGPIFYTCSITPFGQPATWAIPSDTEITTKSAPRIAWLYENIFAVGVAADGRVRYARKDPNRPGNAETGAALSDHWLEPGLDIDATAKGSFSGIETLTFNSDVYLAANKSAIMGQPAGLYLVNFSRAAMKQLMTQKWKMQLIWGEPGGATIKKKNEFATEPAIPALGDFNGDGLTDLMKFTQAFGSSGQAEVYFYRNINGDIATPQLWTPVFSTPGEIPMVGDFDGDGKDDIISFGQQPEYNFDGGLIGYAPVWVQLTSGTQGGSNLWHDNFSPGDEIPFVGDFNGDGKDDIISFSQKVVTDFDGGLIGLAGVWVSLSDGTKFGERQLWHKYFSLSGEIPMVGDFNGDGKDDIVTFTQQNQYNANGSLLGHAPVWVSLSDGTQFGPSSVWQTYFSEAGEVPQVADMNMDGRDDILTFLADKPNTGTAAHDIYVAFSLGNSFDHSSIWHSDFVTKSQVRLGPKKRVYSPQIGHLGTQNGPRALSTWTGQQADSVRLVPDIFAFSKDGSVQVARTMGNVPYPAGAPWERYKFFTDKGIGVALFPEWIYENAGHCIANTHRLALNGSGGVGGGDLTVTSVRYGGRAPHILEELGHSIFANCFRTSSDPFDLVASIFDVPPEQGGIGANALPGCPDSHAFLSCRPDSPGEHYFLQLLSRYRLNPEFFRQRIDEETDPTAQTHLRVQYQWLKDNWFEGLEFATGAADKASLPQPGVPLMPPHYDCGACGAGTAAMMPFTLMLMATWRRHRVRIHRCK